MLPQDDPALRLLTEANGAEMVVAELAKNTAPATAAAAAVNTALAAANQSFTLVWGAQKGQGGAGTTRGTPAYTAPAKFGTAALSAGVLTATNVAPEPIGTSITVEAWFNRAAPPTSNAVALCLSDNLWLGALGTSGLALIRFSGGAASQVVSSVNICDGNWHHIAFEVSRLNGSTIPKGFWIDGQPIPIGAPTIAAQTWVPSITIGGFLTGTTADWGGRIDELRASIGTRYKGVFTPAATEHVSDARTLVLGHLTTNMMDVAVRSYPARPASAPGGSVRYFGPFQPTDWLTDDKWEVMQ